MTISATHLWQPSSARYVQIDGFVPVPRGSQLPPPTPLVWPVKDPGDTLDYVFDVAPALAANPGDTISMFDVMISPNAVGDVSLVSAAADGTRAVLWLTGGQALTTYIVTLSITTAGGRVLARSIALPVAALANVTPPPSGLTTQTGQPLTDPTGTPLTTL